MLFELFLILFVAAFGGADALHPNYGPFVTFKGPSGSLKTGGGTYFYNKYGTLALPSHGSTGDCGSYTLNDCQVCEYDKYGTPSVGYKPAGTSCDDGYFCTYGDACDGSGVCVGPDVYPPVAECTLPDHVSAECAKVTCNEYTDSCHIDLDYNAGNYCNDGLFCTEHERCDAYGVCGSGTPRYCDIGTLDDDCATAACDEDRDSCVVSYHFGGCDDGNACTGADQCSADPHKLGQCEGAQKPCFDCTTCNTYTGECEFDCDDGKICEDEMCVTPPRTPECHYDSDCPVPDCQICNAGGHCQEKLTKDTCTCALADPADRCMECQECAVTSIGDSYNPAKVHTYCSDPNNQCCRYDSDCESALCETCNTYTGFCEVLDSNLPCACPTYAADHCRDCETCVPKKVLEDGSVSFDCVDEAGTCCNSNHDCAIPDCEMCNEDGHCVPDVHQDSCECPAAETAYCAQSCDLCDVTGISSNGQLETNCIDDPELSDDACEECPYDKFFDVFCYKGGSSDLVCVVLGDPSAYQLQQIHDELSADCMVDDTQGQGIGGLLKAYKPKPKTCAGQICSGNIVVTKAAQDTYGEQCLTPFTDHYETPCLDDAIHNIARYQICLEGTPEILDTDDSCEPICGFDGYPCHPEDCPADVPECAGDNHCPEPSHCSYMP